MEYRGRRNRRGRPRLRPMPLSIQDRPQKSCFFCNICSFLIWTSLISIIMVLLKYHCNMCSKKCDIYNITRSIDDIAHNISKMKNSYHDLENNVVKFSYDLPKIEGQVEILEALAHKLQGGDFIWNPNSHYLLPNVDVFVKSESFKRDNRSNVSTKSTKFANIKTD